MKITLANKCLENKPRTDKEKSNYFNGIQFQTVNVKTEDLEKIVAKGYTITYLFKDNQFTRDNSYMKNNYKGTQYICVDIDSCNEDPKQFCEHIEFKPTLVHTTFSNKTEYKDGKWCFHLIYCFDNIIEGEGNFKLVFDTLTESYKDKVDNCAKDCHRVIFTSNSNLDNYLAFGYNIIYKVEDFIKDEEPMNFEQIESLINSNRFCKKMSFLDISISTNNISRNPKILQKQNEETKVPKNEFNLDEGFFHDLFTLDRQTFVYKYSIDYPYITQTVINGNMYVDGYADVRSENYYVVPSAQYQWDTVTGKPLIKKIENGHRTTMLWLDAIAFMKIIPNITKEYLVYLLVAEVFKHFLNGDGQLSNWFIINKAKEVWNNIENLNLTPIKKTFVIDKGYWLKRGYNNWLEVSRLIRKKMKDDDFGSLYDFSKTVEENVEEFKEYGVKCTKKRLIKWLEENNFDYITNKQFRDNMIMYYYNEDNKRSSREIQQLLSIKGIKVSHPTINTVIKRNIAL